MGFANNLQDDRRGKRYRVRVMIRGRIYKKVFRYWGADERATARSEALDYLRLLDSIRAGEPEQEVLGTKITLQKASEQYLADLEKLHSPATTRQYYASKHEGLIRVLGASMPLEAISKRHIADFVEKRGREGVTTGTIKKGLTALRTLQRHFEIQPTWMMPKRTLRHKPKRRRVMPLADVARLWKALDGQARIAVGLCLFIGIRAEEAFRAQASWCNFDAGEFYLPEDGTKKDEPNRTALVKTLRGLLPREGPLVTVERCALGRQLMRACKDLQLPVLAQGPGLFRHVCATTLGELGFADGETALVLSHAYGTMRDRYIHSQGVEKKRKMLEAVEAEFLKYL